MCRQVISVVGKTNDFDAQLTAILMENYLDVSPYKEKLLQNLPSADYVLTTTDIKDREDWRHECIFTIDPDNAIDLEDAVSCKLLDNGNYEVILIYTHIKFAQNRKKENVYFRNYF